MALIHRARLLAGETLLVLGAAGGVGTTAIEIGKLVGARVIGVARGAERMKVATASGADAVIDSEADDLRGAIKALGGADVAYDPVGGAAFDDVLRAMRPEGRIIPIGFAGGVVPQIPANLLLVKNLTVLGVYWSGYLKFRPEVLDAGLAQVFEWYRDGKLRPQICQTLPLDKSADALALLKERRATGKVVITI
jgi:NADPH2:quinone reductase